MQTYVGQYGQYRDLDEAAAVMRALSSGFGPVPSDLWLAMSSHMTRPGPDGTLTLHYDPAIATPFKALTAAADEAVSRQAVSAGEAALWGLYDAIRSPTLLLRGADSDLLTRETAQQMTGRGPKARCVEIPGVGHAPTLVSDEQVSVVRDFLWAA